MYNIITLPDDEPYRYWKMYEDTYVIHYGEALDVFLLLGEKRALLIDTAYGRGEFPNLVDMLKGDRELDVVNTHGHFDHTGGNRWFQRVHMHRNAMAYANRPFKPLDQRWLDNMPFFDYEMVPVEDGQIFALGGRDIEVIWTPAHCDSSLTFLDHKRRLLFCGDELDAGQANLNEFESVEAFLENCRKLMAREAEYDFIMPNHNGCPICKEYLEDFITAAEHVMEGRPDLVSLEGLPGYKLPFDRDRGVRVQVRNSCINYSPKEESHALPATKA